MNDKEYTYDIDKYTIGVDENGEDGIGMTVAKIENGEINFLGNCYGENARCIDLLIKENQELKEKLDKYENPEDMTLMMMWCTEKVKDENEKLTKQLEETKEMIEKCGFVNIEQVMLSYCGLIAQQKEFILYLRHLSNWYSADGVRQGMVNEILQKYKEIIGDK